MTDSRTRLHPAKQAAIEQWTADPCESTDDDSEPGTERYFSRLLEVRHAYAPWLDDILAYDQTAGLDVLDVGCGQGIDLARYAAAGARPTGVDLTPRHVELARMHLRAAGLECEVVRGDAESLPFEDASFDRVSSNGVLHHTPDIEGALREVHRVLRPGGQARIVLYHRDSLHYWGNQVLLEGILRRRLLREGSMSAILSGNVERSSVGARPLVRVYSRRHMRLLLQSAGFEGVTIAIRHLREGDTFVVDMLGTRMQWLLEPRVLDRLGRWAGWYVIGTGSKPA